MIGISEKKCAPASVSGPLLSIFIPTFNGAKSLRLLLIEIGKGIALLPGRETVEVVVSDNASTDDTEKVCSEFSDFISYTRSATNVGFDSNFSRCLSECKGEFIWTIGDDDWVQNSAVRKVINQLKLLRGEEDVTIVKLPFDRVNDVGEKIESCPYPKKLARMGPIESLEVVGLDELLRMSTSIYRRSALTALSRYSLVQQYDVIPLEFSLACLTTGSLVTLKNPLVLCNEGASHREEWSERWPFIANVAIPLMLLQYRANLLVEPSPVTRPLFFRKGYQWEGLRSATKRVRKRDLPKLFGAFFIDRRFYLFLLVTLRQKFPRSS